MCLDDHENLDNPQLHTLMDLICSNPEHFVEQRELRINRKLARAKAELTKANRGWWGEVSKIAVISFASLAGPYGLLAKPMVKGAFHVVSATGAIFALHKVFADIKFTASQLKPENSVPDLTDAFRVSVIPQPPFEGSSDGHNLHLVSKSGSDDHSLGLLSDGDSDGDDSTRT